jgi:hypothetical protein
MWVQSFVQFLTGSACAALTAIVYIDVIGRLNTLLGFTLPLYDYLRFYPPSAQAGFWCEVLGCPLAVATGTVFGVWLGRTKKLISDEEMDPRVRRRGEIGGRA